MSLASGLRGYTTAHRPGWRALDSLAAVRRQWPYTPREVRNTRRKIVGALAQTARADIRFVATDTPKVSVVIPVFNNWPFTRRCLASICCTGPLDRIEVIVVDDASWDATPRLLPSLPGLRILRNDTNLGFTRAANRGARAARAELTLFLNNDTVVMPGCIAALEQAMSDTSVGAVGARLLYPSGRLQEAGAVVWNDATATRNGDGRSPSDSDVIVRRDVDYCSGAALMVRSPLLSRVGFFDERFAPGYYEDTDLCFQVRAHGSRVVVEPSAMVVHWEGSTHGTERRPGVPGAHSKRNQDLNRAKFVEKWAAELARHRHPGSARTRRARETMR